MRRLLRGAGLAAGAAALTISAAGAASGESLADRRHAIEERVDAIEGRIEEARGREEQLGAEIARQSDAIQAVQHRVADLETELTALDSKLTRVRDRLQDLRELLGEQTAQLALLRRQLRVAQDRLAQRLVDIYTSDEPDVLSIVLGADSLDDAIEQLDLYRRTVDQDADLVADVGRLRVEVKKTRGETKVLERRQAEAAGELERRLGERRRLYESAVTERDRLVGLRADRQEALASIVVERKQWEAEADALDAESREIDALLAQQTRSEAASPSESGLIWPVRGVITSPYGMRWGRLHAGIDIAAPAGTPVVAAANGTVVHAGWMGGYGLIVVIAHPNGLATAYAHNSSVAVSADQPVSQGQTIAAVGCTGHCTGDHVHFEVRAGGNPVDPLGYL